jgi:hypothetical protein
MRTQLVCQGTRARETVPPRRQTQHVTGRKYVLVRLDRGSSPPDARSGA